MISTHKLGELVEFEDGDRGVNYPKQGEFTKSGYCLFLSTSNLPSDKFDFSDLQFITQEKDLKLRKGKLKQNDFILTTRGTIGNFAYYSEVVPYKNVRINSGMVLLRSKSEILYPQFLKYILSSPAFKSRVKSFSTGSAQPQLPIRDLSSIKITLPGYKSQEKIYDTISAYDNLIVNNEKRIMILEEITRRLYRNKIFSNAKGEKKLLKDIILEHIGGGWGNDSQSEKYIIPAYVIRGADIENAKGGNTQTIPFRYHQLSNYKSRKLEPGDIVFEVSGGSPNQPLGRSLLITEEFLKALEGSAICASFSKRIKVDKDKLIPEILYLSLLDAQNNGEISSYEIRSTGISNFQWSDYINNIYRIIPSLDVQKAFQNLVKPLFAEIALLGRTNSKLKETRDLLITQLVTGRRLLEL